MDFIGPILWKKRRAAGLKGIGVPPVLNDRLHRWLRERVMLRLLPKLRVLARFLLLGVVLLLAEGCFSGAVRRTTWQEMRLPAERIAAELLSAVNEERASHPQSREALLLEKFYAARGGRPAWIDRHGISLAAWQLLETLDAADGEGLPVERYAPERLRALLTPPADESETFLGWAPAQVVRVDLALSRIFFRYAGDNLWGQERSWRSRGDWHRSRRDVAPDHLLDLALELDAMPSALRGLPSQRRGYVRLKGALRRYRQLAALGGWRPLADGPTLHPGDRDLRVVALRRRLRLEGDLEGDDQLQSELFDDDLQQALALFQQRHGLSADGVLGARSLLELNVPIRRRIEQIVRNLERWRWESAVPDGEEIRINLAAFSLEATDGRSTQLRMPVVIGKLQRPTPLFVSQLEALVLQPYWYVPPTLLDEALPRIIADPTYLRRNHFEVIDGQGESIRVGREFERLWQRGEVEASLRQQPGPWNPMGRIKFTLPNPWSIYLHDTPQKQLFERTRRAFSSGCIRLSQPRQLARWLLANQGLEPAEIDELLATGSSHMVNLKQPVALSVGYWTAWVDDAGRVNFRDDIYGRDKRLARELRQHPPQFAGLR